MVVTYISTDVKQGKEKATVSRAGFGQDVMI